MYLKSGVGVLTAGPVQLAYSPGEVFPFTEVRGAIESLRARGLALTQAEATAIVADAVCEAARDGASYAEAEAAGYAALSPADVLDGVPRLVPRIEVEALFPDGTKLVTLYDPIKARGQA